MKSTVNISKINVFKIRYTVCMVQKRLFAVCLLGFGALVPLVLFAQATSTTTSATSTIAVASTSIATSTGIVMEDRPYAYQSGPDCLVLSRNLSLGKQGSDVYALQRELMITGFLKLSDISGIYDSTTSVAIIQFQSDYNISNSLSGLTGILTRTFFKNLCPAAPIVKPIVQAPAPAVSTNVPVAVAAQVATPAPISNNSIAGNAPTPATAPTSTPYNGNTSQVSANNTFSNTSSRSSLGATSQAQATNTTSFLLSKYKLRKLSAATNPLGAVHRQQQAGCVIF
jgi:peptidoglycan hydrolase-like protein with peptidoglycan-binding domain